MEVFVGNAVGDGVARVRTPITNSGWLRTEEKAKIGKWKWFEKRKAETEEGRNGPAAEDSKKFLAPRIIPKDTNRE
jgi:hypothetical protein